MWAGPNSSETKKIQLFFKLPTLNHMSKKKLLKSRDVVPSPTLATTQKKV